MAIQNDNTLVTKGDLKELFSDKIAPYLGINAVMNSNNKEYYSTEEKVIGVWTDGKPIYQKTSVITSINYHGSNDIGLGSTEVDTIVNYFGNSYLSNGSAYSLNSSNCDGLEYSTGAILELVDHVPNLSLRFGTGRRTMTKIVVTVQYTKLADAAGSAATTPGAYDINFPNTWLIGKEIFFGNGVYGVRLQGSLPERIHSGIWNFGNVFTIMNYGGALYSGDACVEFALGNFFPTTNPSVSTYGFGFQVQAKTNSWAAVGELDLFAGGTTYSSDTKYDIWFTYIKSR